MENMKVQNYLNPITFEAEMFVNSLEELSKTYNSFDVNLVNSLEKVMLAVETFLDQSPNEIVATENTQLVACDDIKIIKRIYRCSRCKTDLGKSVEKVTLHLTTQCSQGGGGSGDSKQSSETYFGKPLATGETAGRGLEIKKELRKEKRKQQQDKQLEQAVKLTKKTRSLLTTDWKCFFEDMVKIGEKLKCLPEYDVIEKDLLSLITPLFPNQNIKVYKFGSRLSGIGTRESDLDLFIDIGDTFTTFQNRARADTLKKLNKVYDVLKIHQKSWKGLLKVDKARVPILTMIHARTGIECDINFSNSLGNINTKLIEHTFTLQPIARLLCIFFKKWLNRTQLNNEINTYTIILMVLFYLQNLGILPAIEKLQENLNLDIALKVGPWIGAYGTLTLNELNIPLAEITQENIVKHIIGFFQYYIDFEFEKYVVCPYLGKLVKREDLEKQMPNRYTTYVKTSTDYVLELKKPFVVQDPIQLNHNVTKALSFFSLQVFKSYMAKSMEIMKYGDKASK